MSRLVTFESIMQEYEEAQRSNCFACAGLGYILKGDSLENLIAINCTCKRGRLLQTATIDVTDWFQVDLGHDQGFFEGSTVLRTLK